MELQKIKQNFIGLIGEKPLSITKRNCTTNNELYIIETKKGPYIYKSTPNADKELFSYDFMYVSNFLPVFENTVGGNDFMLQKFDPDVVYMTSEMILDDILRRQKNMLNSPSDSFDSIIYNTHYKNKTPNRMFARLEKHDLSFAEKSNIKNCLEDNFGYRNDLPKIFVHGDLIAENVLLTKDGIKYIDFERSVYDSLTWELPPILFRSDIKEVSYLINKLIKKTDLDSKLLKKAMMFDYVSFLTTFGISVQQSLPDGKRKESYLLRIENHLRSLGL